MVETQALNIQKAGLEVFQDLMAITKRKFKQIAFIKKEGWLILNEPAFFIIFLKVKNAPLNYTPNNNLVGSSSSCLTRTRKPTDSRPSIIL
jgi:hypothetical protein